MCKHFSVCVVVVRYGEFTTTPTFLFVDYQSIMAIK